MSEFKATLRFIDESEIHLGSKSTTNKRNLKVIELLDKGDCKVSSVSEVPLIAKNGGQSYAFKVEFSTVHNEDVQSIIEKFNEVFVVKSISEVGKN